MKCFLPASALSDAISSVQQAVAARTTKPVLSNVKITAKNTAADGFLTVAATDLEVSATRTLAGVTVQQGGEVVIDPKRAGAICRELDGEVSIWSDGGVVTLANGPRNRWQLPTLDPAEFPVPPEVPEDAVTVGLNAADLLGLIRATSYAVKKDDNTARFSCTGLHIEVEDGVVRFVATDTKRLAIAECAVAGLVADKRTPLVPLKAVGLWGRNLDESDGSVSLAFTDAGVWLTTGTTVIQSRLVEGKFPPWRQFWPKKAAGKFTIEADKLAQAVRQAAITADAENKRVDVTVGATGLALAARGAETGASEVEVGVEYAGPDVVFGIDPSYLLECLRSFAGKEVTVELTDGAKPVVFRCGELTRAMVMPLGDA